MEDALPKSVRGAFLLLRSLLSERGQEGDSVHAPLYWPWVALAFLLKFGMSPHDIQPPQN